MAPHFGIACLLLGANLMVFFLLARAEGKRGKEDTAGEEEEEEKCKDAQNIPFTFRLRLCSLPIFHLDQPSALTSDVFCD